MLRKILLLAVTSGLAARAYRAYTQHRAQTAKPVDKEAVKVWEDEGGALKTQPGPR
jgi:hypothetical protein